MRNDTQQESSSEGATPSKSTRGSFTHRAKETRERQQHEDRALPANTGGHPNQKPQDCIVLQTVAETRPLGDDECGQEKRRRVGINGLIREIPEQEASHYDRHGGQERDGCAEPFPQELVQKPQAGPTDEKVSEGDGVKIGIAEAVERSRHPPGFTKPSAQMPEKHERNPKQGRADGKGVARQTGFPDRLGAGIVVDSQPLVLVAQIEIVVESEGTRIGVVPEGITSKSVAQKMELSHHHEEHDQETRAAWFPTVISEVTQSRGAQSPKPF